MNREWSDKNRLAQSKLKKATFQDGINEFVELLEMLMQEMISWKHVLSPEDYYSIPFINAPAFKFYEKNGFKLSQGTICMYSE